LNPDTTFLRALRREPTPHTPVWLMRQAGRYLPEYNRTRAKAGSFLALAKTPELATEVTLQPLARYPARRGDPVLGHPDGAPTRWASALSFAEGEGPRFARTVRDERDAAARSRCPTWRRCATCSTRSRRSSARSAGRVPLIGFAGSPFTLACYMIEGSGSDDFRRGAHDGRRAARPASIASSTSTRARSPPTCASRSSRARTRS
jgi:uroporphyrinogen decarboxylase